MLSEDQMPDDSESVSPDDLNRFQREDSKRHAQVQDEELTKKKKTPSNKSSIGWTGNEKRR